MKKEQTNWENEFDNKFLGTTVDFPYGTMFGDLYLSKEIKQFIAETISQEREKMIEEFRKKLTNTEMTIVFSSTTGNDTKQKVPMYQPQQIEELINLLSDN